MPQQASARVVAFHIGIAESGKAGSCDSEALGSFSVKLREVEVLDARAGQSRR